MSHPDTVIPISAALEAIGIESKDPGAWRRYWTKLGAPIVAGSWVGSRERYGADPEALRQFVEKRNEQVAEEARSRIIVPPTPGARKREGFRYSDDEGQEMYKRCPVHLKAEGGQSACQLCQAVIPDIDRGWHAFRTIMITPESWAGSRGSDGIVLLCERCVPFWDNLRREAFERAAPHFRLVRTAVELSPPRGADPAVVARHKQMALATPQPTEKEIIETAHNLFATWIEPLVAQEFVTRRRLEYSPDTATRPALSRTIPGGATVDLFEWMDSRLDAQDPISASMVQTFGYTAEPGLRLELTRGRPPVFRSGGWYRQEPTTYAYDGERRW